MIEEMVTLEGVIYVKSLKHYVLFNELHEVYARTSVVIPFGEVCYGVKGNFTLVKGNVKRVDDRVCWNPSQRSVSFKYSKRAGAGLVEVKREALGLRISVMNPNHEARVTLLVKDFGEGRSGIWINGKKVLEFFKDCQYEFRVRPGESITLNLKRTS